MTARHEVSVNLSDGLTGEQRHAQYLRRRFDAKVEDLADQVRRLADRIEREGLGDANRIGAPEYAWKASKVVHVVMWGLANADLDGLVLAAAEADAIGSGGNIQ